MQELKCAECGRQWKWDGKQFRKVIVDGSGMVILRLTERYMPQPTHRNVATCPECRFAPKRIVPSGNDTSMALAERQRAKKGRTDS